ncbi:hypothetical protein P7K49_035882, partial [Saguinus oedipus]
MKPRLTRGSESCLQEQSGPQGSAETLCRAAPALPWRRGPAENSESGALPGAGTGAREMPASPGSSPRGSTALTWAGLVVALSIDSILQQTGAQISRQRTERNGGFILRKRNPQAHTCAPCSGRPPAEAP